MSRKNKVIRNIILIVILLILFFNRANLYLTPFEAHKSSERSIHYGPSKVVYTKDYDGGKYFLCKYDKWISCNSVKRILFIFWTFGDQVTGFENDMTKAVDYTWGMSNGNMKLYGIANDDRIKRIEIQLSDGRKLTQTRFYEQLFLITWKSSDYDIKNVKGFDQKNNVLFDEKL